MTVITVIIFHDDYEAIKEGFTKLRNKWSLRYTNHSNTKHYLFHEWTGKHDKLESYYILSQSKPFKPDGKPNVEEIQIIYTYDIESGFVASFSTILNTISPYYIQGRQEYKPPEPKVEITIEEKPITIDTIAMQKIQFMYSIGMYDNYCEYPLKWSFTFINNTLEAIGKGLVSVYSLRYQPLGGYIHV